MELLKTFLRLKYVSDFCSPALTNIWNEDILLHKNFPENHKLVDVLSTVKKENFCWKLETSNGSTYSF